MSRWIEYEPLMAELEREVELSDDWKTAHEIANVAKYAPSIDIVRCGECKWFDSGKNDSEIWSMCTRHFGKYIDVNADDFCSYGERSEKPNNCESQTIRCPKCGRTDYIRDMEKDMGIKGSHYKYKCINCNTYIKDEPQKSCSTCGYSPQTPSCDTCDGYSNWWSLDDEPQTERSE